MAAETVRLLRDDASTQHARRCTTQHELLPAEDRTQLLSRARQQRTQQPSDPSEPCPPTVIEIWPATPTLAATLELASASPPDGVCALVFASAKNPGGGYLKGSLAQEESLAVASALALCQEGQPLYAANRRDNCQALYHNSALFSPTVCQLEARNWWRGAGVCNR